VTDYIYLVNRPGDDEPHPEVITDLEAFFTEWLASLYADPEARAQAAARSLELGNPDDPGEAAAREFEPWRRGELPGPPGELPEGD
jgi:hypothetical protein